MAKTRGGHKVQVRRSSRIQYLSWTNRPKTDPIHINLEETTEEQNMSTPNTSGRIIRMANKRSRQRAGRPNGNFNEPDDEEQEEVRNDVTNEDEEIETGEEEETNDLTDEENEMETEQEDDRNNIEEFENNEEEDIPPQQKNKITKFKRKKVNDCENDFPRKKITGIMFPTIRYPKTVDQKAEGAPHINKQKHEVKLRISPRQFSAMIYHLTDEQRKWVRNAGFSLLLDFNLEMLPTKISYNVLQIFDNNARSLKLKNAEINIKEEDVFDVLGLPYGGVTITLAPDEKYKQRTEQWYSQFETEKEKEQVTAQKIVQLMKDQPVNDNFKLNFIILMSNVLVGTTSCSYVDKQLLRLDDDLDNLRKYNWAEYLLTYLVHATDSWNTTATTFFRGSLIFLTLFYVDRVRHKGIKLVDREFPTYIGWTEERLKTRQKMEIIDGVFGVGSIVPPLRDILQENDKFEVQNKNANENDDSNKWEAWKSGNDENDDCYDWDELVERQKRRDSEKFAGDGGNDAPDLDIFEELRFRAQEILDQKFQFDDELRKAKERFPNNETLKVIEEVFNENFPSNGKNDATENDNATYEKDDAGDKDDLEEELSPDTIANLDLVEYLYNTRSKINKTTGFTAEEYERQFIPSFSLGINDEEAENVNENAEDYATPNPEIREKSTRVKKVGPYAKSPFVDRVVDIKTKLNNLDYGLWRLLTQNGDPLEIMFSWNEIESLREHLQTLKPNSSLYYSVVDVWVTILNDSEKYKSDDSPLRLFCTVGDLVFSLDVTKKFAETLPIFSSGMEKILKTFNVARVEDADMVFFPINRYEHYFLVCYNIKNPAMYLIDNIQREDNERSYYGKIVDILHSHFCNFLNQKGSNILSKKIRKLKPSYLKMTWQTMYNSSDCGIFLMRHMETFKGDVKNWNTELVQEGILQVKQLRRLRVKYATAILSSQLNEHREPIMKQASILYTKAAERNLLELVKSASIAPKSSIAQKNGTDSAKKTVTFAANLTTTFEQAADKTTD